MARAQHKDHPLCVVDFRQWLAALVALVDRFQMLRAHLGHNNDCYGKARLTGVLKVSPYVNMPLYVAAVEKYGIPVLQDDEVLIPVGESADTFVTIESGSDLPPEVRSLVAIGPLSVHVLRAIGVPITTESASEALTEVLYNIVSAVQASCRVNGRQVGA